MIRINLLPPELTKAKRERPKIVSAPSSTTPVVVLVLVIVYIAVAAFAYWVYDAKRKDDAAVEQLRIDRDNLKKEIEAKQEEFKELMELKTLLANQLEILNALNPPNRLYWSEKLNMLADLVPKGVYLTNINVTEQVIMQETDESKLRRKTWVEAGEKGDPPPVIKKPVITQTLSLSGITWADDPEQRLQLIIRFHDSLKAYEMTGLKGKKRRFMDNFENLIRIAPTWVDTVAGREVNRFKLILKTKPFTMTEE